MGEIVPFPNKNIPKKENDFPKKKAKKAHFISTAGHILIVSEIVAVCIACFFLFLPEKAGIIICLLIIGGLLLPVALESYIKAKEHMESVFYEEEK